MNKLSYSHPTMTVKTTVKQYNGRYGESSGDKERLVDYNQIVDGTPAPKKASLQIKPKRSVKERFARVGNFKVKIPKDPRVEGKSKQKRLTRKSDVKKDYHRGPTGDILIRGSVAKKLLAATRDCTHRVNKLYPFIDDNFYDFRISGGYAAYLGSDGKAEGRQPVVVIPDLGQRFTTNAYSDSLRLCNEAQIDPLLWQRIIKNNLPKPEQFLPCVNVIAMLVELGASLKYVSQTLDLVKQLVNTVAGPGKVADTAANARLWWSFGTSPMASDIAGLLGLLLHFSDIIEDYNKRATRKIFTVHRTVYRRDLKYEDFSEIKKAQYVNSDGTYRWYSQPSGDLSGKILGKLVLKIRLKPLSSTWAERVLSHCLGLDDIVLGLWEGVPFSWLVDYFVNTAELIQFYTSTELILPYEIIDCSWSRKVSGTGSKNMDVTYRLNLGTSVNGVYRWVNGRKVYYVQPGGLLSEDQSHQVKSSCMLDIGYYDRRNVTSLAKRYAIDDYYQKPVLRRKVPKIGQLLNASSVGYLQARSKEQIRSESEAFEKKMKEKRLRRKMRMPKLK